MKALEKQKLQKEVQKRLNDPNWDKKMSKAIVQKLHPLRNKQYIISFAAAALIFIFLNIFYFGNNSNSMDSITIDDIYSDIMGDMVVYEEFIESF
ncbi:MAG: hypothetical protein H7A23_25285 [Leptospiraceae bacterium]|nr:hypothetical protein [Leptospiraceae bacterium]MCP5497882.1 hypothetical protein [Leptospiraceae bacterium]